ncbi:MAG: type IX secretion system protein PorQ [Porphyromonadaceae bacterium]|nr:type IX secretion system protein PorQ [Porphyromonadaceae bacterium]
MKKLIILLVVVLLSAVCWSQAGKGVYQVLDLPMDARSIGLGGTNVSLFDGDLNLALNNPALLSNKSHNMFTLNYARYLAGINFGSVGYGRTLGENNFALAVNYLDFGKFQEYNELDIYQGEFTAKDMVLNILYSRQFGKYFSVGAMAKVIYSAYERYSSAGMAIDFGANYHDENNLFDMGLTVKNMGFQFNGYHSIEGSNHREPIPVNILFGVSKKLKQAPLKFSFTLHNLQRFNLNYERTSATDKEYKQVYEIKWYDMMFRHAIVGVEIVPSNNFYLSVAYNYRRNAEMNIPSFRSIAGFSFGAGIKVKDFRVAFALAQFQSGNLTTHFTISTDLKGFGVK